MQPFDRANLEVSQAADVVAGRVAAAAALLGHQPHVHLPPVAAVRPQPEFDLLGRCDVEPVICTLRVVTRRLSWPLADFALAANGHGTAQLAP